jgi:hypothetical protein
MKSVHKLCVLVHNDDSRFSLLVDLERFSSRLNLSTTVAKVSKQRIQHTAPHLFAVTKASPSRKYLDLLDRY